MLNSTTILILKMIDRENDSNVAATLGEVSETSSISATPATSLERQCATVSEEPGQIRWPFAVVNSAKRSHPQAPLWTSSFQDTQPLHLNAVPGSAALGLKPCRLRNISIFCSSFLMLVSVHTNFFSVYIPYVIHHGILLVAAYRLFRLARHTEILWIHQTASSTSFHLQLFCRTVYKCQTALDFFLVFFTNAVWQLFF